MKRILFAVAVLAGLSFFVPSAEASHRNSCPGYGGGGSYYSPYTSYYRVPSHFGHGRSYQPYSAYGRRSFHGHSHPSFSAYGPRFGFSIGF